MVTSYFQGRLDDLVRMSRTISARQEGATRGLIATSQGLRHFRETYSAVWECFWPKPMRTDYSPDWLVQQAYYCTFGQRRKRMRRDAFYSAHVCLLNKVCLDTEEGLRDAREVEKGISDHRMQAVNQVISELTGEGIHLLQLYAVLKREKFEWRIIPSTLAHYAVMYRAALRIGAGGLLLPSPWAALTVLRQAIEVRVRSALDVQGLLVRGAFRKVPVVELLDELSGRPDISSGADLSLVKRIYRWANMYIHTGFHEFPWLVSYALWLLMPFMQGVPEPSGAWSVDSGLEVPAEVVEEIWTAIRKRHGKEHFVDTKIVSFQRQRPQ